MFYCSSRCGFTVQADAGEFSVLGGLDLAKSTFSPELVGVVYSGVSKFTLGVDYDYSFTRKWGVEVGLFYQSRGGKQTLGTRVGELGYHSLTVPIMVRYTLIPHYLSVGAGIYGSYGLGRVTLTEMEGSTVVDTQSAAYDVARVSRSDFGLVWGVRGSYRVTQRIEVIGDIRYYYGLKNLRLSSSETLKSTDLAVLVGARLAL